MHDVRVTASSINGPTSTLLHAWICTSQMLGIAKYTHMCIYIYICKHTYVQIHMYVGPLFVRTRLCDQVTNLRFRQVFFQKWQYRRSNNLCFWRVSGGDDEWRLRLRFRGLTGPLFQVSCFTWTCTTQSADGPCGGLEIKVSWFDRGVLPARTLYIELFEWVHNHSQWTKRCAWLLYCRPGRALSQHLSFTWICTIACPDRPRGLKVRLGLYLEPTMGA